MAKPQVEFMKEVEESVKRIIGYDDYSLFKDFSITVDIDSSEEDYNEYTVYFVRDHGLYDIQHEFNVRESENNTIIEYDFEMNTYDDNWVGIHDLYESTPLWITILSDIEDKIK